MVVNKNTSSNNQINLSYNDHHSNGNSNRMIGSISNSKNIGNNNMYYDQDYRIEQYKASFFVLIFSFFFFIFAVNMFIYTTLQSNYFH